VRTSDRHAVPIAHVTAWKHWLKIATSEFKVRLVTGSGTNHFVMDDAGVATFHFHRD
jgi:hypothetical protein